jgi:protein TonB
MKKVLLLILIFTSQNILSQKEIHKISKTQKDKNAVIISKDEDKIYKVIEVDLKPEFPGGRVKFNKFIDKNYKKSNKKPTAQGFLFATFIVEKDGSLSDIKALKDIGFGTGQELIRVLKLSPKWKPGKQNNKQVRTLYSLVVPVQQ